MSQTIQTLLNAVFSTRNSVLPVFDLWREFQWCKFKYLQLKVGLSICIFVLFTSTVGFAQTEIPYVIGKSGHYQIDVKVNDKQSFPFYIDTAAQNTSIYPIVVQSLELKPEVETIYVQGATGGMRVNVHRIKSIQAGGRKMKNFRAAVLPFMDELDGVGGILGLDFLQKYAVEFHPDTMTITLHRNGKKLKQLKKASSWVPITRNFGGFIFFDVELEGQFVSGLLDTGARRNVINWKAANQMGILPLDARVLPEDPIIGVSGIKVKSTAKTKLKSLQIGDQIWLDQSVTIVDLGIFRYIGMKNKPAGIFGVKVFKDRHFLIDFKNKKLMFFDL